MKQDLTVLLRRYEQQIQEATGLRGTLQFVYTNPVQQLPIETVIQIGCTLAGVSYKQVTGPLRKAQFVRLRHLLCLILHKQLGHHCTTVGQYLGNRDHSTVLHGCQSMTKALATGDPAATLLYEQIISKTNEYAATYAQPPANDHPGGPADADTTALASIRLLYPAATVHIDRGGRPPGPIPPAGTAGLSHKAGTL